MTREACTENQDSLMLRPIIMVYNTKPAQKKKRPYVNASS